MHDPPRAVVTFQAMTFNRSTPRSHFINPDCFGDDVAAWLIAELRGRGIDADEQPGAEDFGWYVRFALNGTRYCAVVGHRPGDSPDDGHWVIWLERDVGFLRSFLGRRDKHIQPEAAYLLDDILRTSSDVGRIRWHHKQDFDAGHDEPGALKP